MSADATTVHQLFGLCIAPSRDIEPREIATLAEKFKDGLCLLVIDEFSMVSRALMGFILERLKFAKLDLKRVGIIMIGDPAQLLPIGGEPCWSIKLTRMDSKPFHEYSTFGIEEMRSTFRMTRLESIPKYNDYKRYEKQRKTNEFERRAIAEFTLAAMEGDYDAVYLTDVRRTIDGDAQSDNFVKNLIPRCRYGRTTEQDLRDIKQAFA